MPSITTDVATEHLVIQQGADFHWVALEALDDGTIRNLAGWTGTFTVYPGSDFTAAPVIASAEVPNNAVLELGLNGIGVASTTLAADAAEGDTMITVTDATGFALNDRITVVQNEVSILDATITAVAGTTITLSVPLTDGALTGNAVDTWDPDWDLYNLYIHMADSATGVLTSWGVGSWDLRLTDPFDHTYPMWYGRASLQGGTH